jgi:hypothetical protein
LIDTENELIEKSTSCVVGKLGEGIAFALPSSYFVWGGRGGGREGGKEGVI